MLISSADIAACSDAELAKKLKVEFTEPVEARDEVHERIYLRYLDEDCLYCDYVRDGKPISFREEDEEFDPVSEDYGQDCEITSEG